MTTRHRAIRAALAGAAVLGAATFGAAPAVADPVPPPAPPTTPTVPVPPPPAPPPPSSPMTPRQPALPPADPAAPPADPAAEPVPPPVFTPDVPEIPNAQYGSGKFGDGVLGTLMDLWDQAKNPTFTQDEILGLGGERPTRPPGAGPATTLPPGYISTNSPGSEAPSAGVAEGPEGGRIPLPPGYYPLDGPPPPGYFDPPPTPIPVMPATIVPGG